MKIKDLNEAEAMAYKKLRESASSKNDALIFEAIADKFYRHQYCLVGHDLVECVKDWFIECEVDFEIQEFDTISKKFVFVSHEDKCTCDEISTFVNNHGCCEWCFYIGE